MSSSTGKQPPSPDDVRKLVGVYGVGENEIEKYVTIARQARQRDWWHKYDDVLPEWFEGYLGLEAEASKISTYESDLVPGLLQTEHYAAAVLGAFSLRTTPEEMERSVDLRRTRQARLSDDKPLILDAVISETALRRAIGGAAVMREQLQHVMAMMEQPNITLSLLPFAAGEHPGLDGAFSVLEFPDPDDGRIVTVETMTATLYIEKIRDIGIYRLAFDQIRAATLGPDDTADMITNIMRELGTMSTHRAIGCEELTHARWIKSSRSGSGGGNCVGVAALHHGGQAVRDSKDPAGPVLTFTHAAWSAFTAGVRHGEFH